MRDRNLDNYRLISFDVENCFTNISTELAIRIVERDFDEFVKNNTNIPKTQFINLLKFCLVDCNYFAYEDKFIAMKSGLFMGSSLAPILVERVLDTIIDETLQKLDFTPAVWCSYVDDHITAIPENKIQHVLDALHEFDPSIKFTYEVEQNARLDYLDLSVWRRENGKLITNWYHKPIASNRLLNFYSNHPKRMKFNVAKSFIRKIFRVSHKEFWSENLQRIRDVLFKNNYPENVITKLIGQVRKRKPTDASESYAFLSKTRIDETTQINDETITISQYSSLAYVPGLSETIDKSCKQFVPTLKLAMRPYRKNASMFANLKSRINPDDKSGLVYKLDCANCSAIYIGETIQKFGVRKSQHCCDCNKPLTKFSSALAKHAKNNDHGFKFDEGKILKRERNKTKLQIHEVNQIIKFESNACNEKTDKKDYTNTYVNLIKNSK